MTEFDWLRANMIGSIVADLYYIRPVAEEKWRNPELISPHKNEIIESRFTIKVELKFIR